MDKCKTLEKNYWWLWDGQLLFSPVQLKTSNPQVLCRLQGLEGREGSEGRVPLPCCVTCCVWSKWPHLRSLQGLRASHRGEILLLRHLWQGQGPACHHHRAWGHHLCPGRLRVSPCPASLGWGAAALPEGLGGCALLLWLGTLWGHVLNAPLGKNLKSLCHTGVSAAVLVPFSVSIASLCSCWFTRYPFSSHSRRWQGLSWPGPNSGRLTDLNFYFYHWTQVVRIPS